MASLELSTALQTLSKDAKSLVASIESTLLADKDSLTTPNGPSLLTLKNSSLLFYMHNLILLTAHRLRGHALNEGEEGHLLVRNLIKIRLLLEKIKPVESKMRSLVERLLRTAEEDDKRRKEGRVDYNDDDAAVEDMIVGDIDPLSFRPNIAALTVNGESSTSSRSKRDAETAEKQDIHSSRDRGDGIYQPPRMAPVVYDGHSTIRGGKKAKEDKRGPMRNSTLLSEMSASLSSNPYEVSSSGVGVNGTGQGASSRAKALARMDAYEEDNFTRLTMSKKDAKRRRRDEEDVALGGAGLSSKKGRVGAGLEEEFGDLLRNKTNFDRVKRKGAMQRAKDGRGDNSGGGAGWDDLMGGGGSSGKKNAFQKGMRGEKRKARGKGRN
ncbi:hypothetical protein CBS101457_004038 [Exobasidium rhododendri]|nr:hypothetical protein CBS101457_004038 [Exobasidium rhododendri]